MSNIEQMNVECRSIILYITSTFDIRYSSVRYSFLLIFAAMNPKPLLHTVVSPKLLDIYDISNSIVVIIDVFRATSTIATALYKGATRVIPVDSVEQCIEIGKRTKGITAGERDGKVI